MEAVDLLCSRNAHAGFNWMLINSGRCSLDARSWSPSGPPVKSSGRLRRPGSQIGASRNVVKLRASLSRRFAILAGDPLARRFENRKER
jgi:hypothetical protein